MATEEIVVVDIYYAAFDGESNPVDAAVARQIVVDSDYVELEELETWETTVDDSGQPVIDTETDKPVRADS